MTQREQFESWIVAKGLRFNSADYFMWLAWQAAQAANDAEAAELREKLAKCRELFEMEVDTVSREWNQKFEAAEEACGL